MSEYTEQANKFLAAHSLAFAAFFIGEDCPTFCEDAQRGDALRPGTFPRTNHIHGSHWRLTLTRAGKPPLTVDCWDSYADAEARHIRKTGTCDNLQAAQHGIKRSAGGDYRAWDIQRAIPADIRPGAYDLLACLEKYEPGTFADWAGDLGYDTDSRRALAIYEAVQRQWMDVRRFFSAEELEELHSIQ